MRKHLIFAAIAALGALICSCEREKDIKTYSAKADEVSLVLGGIATRSASEAPIVRNNYDLGEVMEGVKFSLEEVVTEMGDLVDNAPETRGTPAYSQNVTDVHGSSFNGEIWGASGIVAADGAFEVLNLGNGKNAWRRDLGYDAWSRAGGPVTFALHMPSTPNGVSNITATYAGTIDFDFETPASASDQQDILFGVRNIGFDDYINEYKANGGASVLFRHALTGVKFAIGNNTTQSVNRTPDGEVQTFITKVEIKGLKDKGHAKFQPDVTEETYTDVTDKFSSASSFTWTPGTTTGTYTQTYGDDDIQDFQSGDAVNAPESFYKGGANRNLNKADASLTFWFVPQEITSDLEITVTVKVWSGKEMGTTQEINLKMGELILAQQETTEVNKTWKAGQIRTFTLKPNMVDVDITDEVDGYKKTQVVITNTGNTQAYIRANIIANWYGKTLAGDDGIAMGYLANEAGDAPATPLTFVEPWSMEWNAAKNKYVDNYNGVFDDLPVPGTQSAWVRCKDGYFYFTEKVDPGKATPTALFTKYELNTANGGIIPKVMYLSTTGGYKLFTDFRLMMDLTVQAIEAKADVTDWKAAWGDEKVLGTAPVPVSSTGE